jgi:ppGpp synthetase/RelA/SpoT-type nucleotidyltranferase
MIEGAILKEVRRFIDRYGSSYEDLAEVVRKAAETVKKEVGHDIVRDVYSRKTKQGTELKSVAKIAEKIWRKRRESGKKNFKIIELNDIIGVTIVIQYPDQVESVATKLEQRLRGEKIDISKPETHGELGYYAHHADCISRRANSANFLCEIQIKTMLQDAWSTKMHDLTYKPQGRLDRRLKGLMQSIGDTLQLIEQQSAQLRDMIQEQWNVEEQTRKIARERLFESLPSVKKIRTTKSEVRTLIRQINQMKIELENASRNDHVLMDMGAEVAKLCRRYAHLGWLAAFELARLRPQGDQTNLFETAIDEWLGLSKAPSDSREVITIPLMFYSLGDLENAVSYSHRILEDFSKLLTKGDKSYVLFNLANFLVEQEYYHPNRDPKVHKQQEKYIRRLFKRAGGARADAEVRQSTEGFMLITFGNTPDDIRKGIKLCDGAKSSAAPDEKKIAEAFSELYVRLGWRRLIQLGTSVGKTP